MRKTIVTVAALLGVAPTALATSGPPQHVPLLGTEPQGRSEAAPELRAEARRKLAHAERRARRAAAERRKRARAQRAERARGRGLPGGVPPQLQAIAQCESGGDPAAIGGGGLYRGKYQFSRETWAAVGGSGDPAQAPEGEQDRRAAQLYAQAGPGQWPVCGR